MTRPERYRPSASPRATAMSCGESRSKTRRVSGSSPAVTSSPVMQLMFSMPCIAAPTISASRFSRLRSRHASCMTGSTPQALSAIATARGEACACAAALSVALIASTHAFIGASWRWISGEPPPSIVGISAVTTKSPASSFRSRRDISRRPSGRGLLVAAGHEVAPRRRALEAIVDRWAQAVDVRAPDRELLGPVVGLDPHAAHLRLDLAAAVRAHAATRAVAQRLRARHRAREPGVVQDALPAHAAVPDRPLDRVLDRLEQAHAGTRARRSSMSALAFLTADEASAE